MKTADIDEAASTKYRLSKLVADLGRLRTCTQLTVSVLGSWGHYHLEKVEGKSGATFDAMRQLLIYHQERTIDALKSKLRDIGIEDA